MMEPGGLREEVDVNAYQGPTWENLPKLGVLIFDPEPVSEEQYVLIRKITSDFQFDEIPTKRVYVYKNPSDDYFTFYEVTARTHTSPWKGMNAYVPGRPLLQTDPDSAHPLVWILERIGKEPKNLSHAGITMRYIIEPDKRISLEFYLKTSKIAENLFASMKNWPEIFRKKSQVVLKNIILGPCEGFDPIHIPDELERKGEIDFDKMFAYVKKYQEQEPVHVAKYKLNTQSVKSNLLQYQKDTVRWMIGRELNQKSDATEKFLDFELLANGKYYYPYLGIIAHHLPTDTDRSSVPFDENCSVKGGILADEMGLGKTVQMLSLIASHPRDVEPMIMSDKDVQEEENSVRVVDLEGEEEEADQRAEMERISAMTFAEMSHVRSGQSSISFTIPANGTAEDVIQCSKCQQFCVASICGIADISQVGDDFKCPECINLGEREEIKTTLVIVPESLVLQWSTEVQKHCLRGLKAMFYFGVKKHGYIQPTEMDKYDVVLTTYDTLRNDAGYMESKSQGVKRNLRTPNQAAFVITPLVHCNFWRIVVDESQVMPQSMSSNFSKILDRMTANNWWCVTGTPLVKTLSDFLPLFTFLNLRPFSNVDFLHSTVLPEYYHLIRNTPLDTPTLPFSLLLHILSKCVSRKTKKEVESQLALPGLVEIEKLIAFTAIEERQYKEELERLKASVKRSLGNAQNAALLQNLNVREKVLHELKSLKETILTGQNNRADLTRSGCIYAPETVIFRLVVSKKTKLLEKFRLFVMSGHALAGVHILTTELQNAQDDYQFILSVYNELHDMEQFFSTTLGAEKIKELCGFPEDSDEKAYFDEKSDAFQIPGDEEEHQNRPADALKERELVKMWKEVEKMKKSFGIKEDPSGSSSSLGPAPKKIKMEIEEEQEQKELRKETELRAKHAKKFARMALKPMKMDLTQEVHLILNMHSVQKKLNFSQGNLLDTQRLEPLLEQDYGKDVQKMGELKKELLAIGEAFNGNDLITPCIAFIKSNYVNHPRFLHSKQDLAPIVEKEILPLLPVNLLFDEQKAKTVNIPKHVAKFCMGACGAEKAPMQFVGSKKFLKLDEVVERMCGWMEDVEKRRVAMVAEMDEMFALVLEMSRPSSLITLLLTPPTELDENFKKMLEFFNCPHLIIKGTKKETEGILKNFNKENDYCSLCNLYAKLSKLQFDAGFTSFHGHEKSKSGVFEFAQYFVNNLVHSPDKAVFLKETLSPLFARFHDLTSTYKKCIVNVILDLIFQLEVFYQAKSTITEQSVLGEMGNHYGASRRAKLESYAAKQVSHRTDHLKKFRTDLGELRYLANLMKEQFSEGSDFDECPVCKCQIESFMVYTCGHRVCPECFEHLKTRARRDYYNNDTITCPTCRQTINCHQVMLARSGFAEQAAVVPGMVISAKLTTAILLIREILEQDEKNKTILFTQVDPSSTRVWGYLQKVLRLARLPFMAISRNQFGKKVSDFDLGDNAKILLCSYSYCANGLNITGANHIIFLDPPHQKSVLQQAMGRINRFGQRSAMKVFHIVVEGSLDVELRSTAKNRAVEDEKKGWTVGEIKQMFGIADEPPSPSREQRRQLRQENLDRLIEMGFDNHEMIVDFLMDHDMPRERQFMEDQVEMIRDRLRDGDVRLMGGGNDADDEEDAILEEMIMDPDAHGHLGRENEMWDQIHRRRLGGMNVDDLWRAEHLDPEDQREIDGELEGIVDQRALDAVRRRERRRRRPRNEQPRNQHQARDRIHNFEEIAGLAHLRPQFAEVELFQRARPANQVPIVAGPMNSDSDEEEEVPDEFLDALEEFAQNFRHEE